MRNGDITRDEAVALVKRYDGEYSPRFEKEIFEYLSIATHQFGSTSDLFEQPIMDNPLFDALTNRFLSHHFWNFENETWKLRHTVY